MLTAAHCRLSESSGTVWTVANPSGTAYQTTEQYSGFGTGNGDAEVFTSLGSEAAKFYYNSTSYRSVSGALNIVQGNTVCHFGWGSQVKACNTIKNVNGSYSISGLSFNHMVFVANISSSADGDSGGPWFNGKKAAGIHQGRVTFMSGVKRLSFTPISQVAATTGVSIALKTS
jgi:hypothetical protein